MVNPAAIMKVMGPVGWQEMVIIFIVALVLFGPRKLPELGRTLGKAITEFRRASNELKSTFEREMQTLERENQDLKQVTSSYVNDVYNTYDSGYDSPYQDSGAYGAYGNESHELTTSSNPTTTGESAVQDAGAENSGVEGTPGTVARTPGTETAYAHSYNPYETSEHQTPEHQPEPESKPEPAQHS
jgi:sec-independent protein translocase protein TatA